MSGRRIILILGDQLSRDVSSLKGARKGKDVIVMGELADEARYVKHHKKKIAYVFSAMRHFAQALKKDGYAVEYQKYDQKSPARSFRELAAAAVRKHKPERVVVTEPGEHRLVRQMKRWRLGVDVEMR